MPNAKKKGYSAKDLREVSDNPEWTRKDFAKARPFSEALPDLAASIRKGRGPNNKETGFSPTVWAGAGSVQSQGAGLAVTDR